MLCRRPSGREPGFTLVEILVVIGIMGIIAMMMIPAFLRALDRAKQRRTMAEMHLTGKAMMSWVTDHYAAAAAGAITTFDIADYGSTVPYDTMKSVLVPTYMPEVPRWDGWHHDFDYRLDIANPESEHALAIRSPGRDGSYSGSQYTFGSFSPTEYHEDLVWADGFFIRWADRVE